MEAEAQPPAYAQHVPPRTIFDLRTQIIANASVLKPRSDTHKASDDHLEVIVAKAPNASTSASGGVATHWASEKQAMAMAEQSLNQQPLTRTGSLPSSSRASARPGQHYAVLVKRNTTYTVKIMLKGEPRDTPEDALEWMLEQTEKLVHDMVVRRGKPADEGCCVM